MNFIIEEFNKSGNQLVKIHGCQVKFNRKNSSWACPEVRHRLAKVKAKEKAIKYPAVI